MELPSLSLYGVEGSLNAVVMAPVDMHSLRKGCRFSAQEGRLSIEQVKARMAMRIESMTTLCQFTFTAFDFYPEHSPLKATSDARRLRSRTVTRYCAMIPYRQARFLFGEGNKNSSS